MVRGASGPALPNDDRVAGRLDADLPGDALLYGRVFGLLAAVGWIAIGSRIVFPIALRQALPAYGNEIILMIKATSLVSITNVH